MQGCSGQQAPVSARFQVFRELFLRSLLAAGLDPLFFNQGDPAPPGASVFWRLGNGELPDEMRKGNAINKHIVQGDRLQGSLLRRSVKGHERSPEVCRPVISC